MVDQVDTYSMSRIESRMQANEKGGTRHIYHGVTPHISSLPGQ